MSEYTDNLAKYNQEMLAEFKGKDRETLEKELKQIEKIIRDCMDIGVPVTHKIRAKSILLVDYISKLK